MDENRHSAPALALHGKRQSGREGTSPRGQGPDDEYASPVFATNRLRRAAPLAPLAAVLGAVVAALLVEVPPWPRHGVDQIRHLVNWPARASITVATRRAGRAHRLRMPPWTRREAASHMESGSDRPRFADPFPRHVL
jgi:hypothetical protein